MHCIRSSTCTNVICTLWSPHHRQANATRFNSFDGPPACRMPESRLPVPHAGQRYESLASKVVSRKSGQRWEPSEQPTGDGYCSEAVLSVRGHEITRELPDTFTARSGIRESFEPG